MTDQVVQACFNMSNIYDRSPSYRINFPMEGTITKVHFPNDESNKSGRYIEYDVYFLMSDSGAVFNVPLASSLSGIIDAQETILRPASTYVPKADGFESNKVGGAFNTDGDRVLVQFINGSPHNPVITHVLPHGQWGRQDGESMPKRYEEKVDAAEYTRKLSPLSLKEGVSYGADAKEAFGKDDGNGESAPDLTAGSLNRHVLARVNGTYWTVDTNGDIFIDFRPHSNDDKGLEKEKVKKKLVIQNEGRDLLRIHKDADDTIELVLAEKYTDADGTHSKVTFKIADLVEIVRDGTTWTATFGDAAFQENFLATFADGAVKVAIADHLKDLWGRLVTYIESHTHKYQDADTPDTDPGGSPSADTERDTAAPTESMADIPATNGGSVWDENIASLKVVIPDNNP